MKRLRIVVNATAFVVLAICVWAFLAGTEAFEGGEEWDNYIAWYFLAKGLFCATSLYLGGLIAERLDLFVREQKDP